MASGYGISASSKDLLVVAGLAAVALFVVKDEVDKITDPVGDIADDLAGVVDNITHPWDTLGGIFNDVKLWGDDDRWFS